MSLAFAEAMDQTDAKRVADERSAETSQLCVGGPRETERDIADTGEADIQELHRRSLLGYVDVTAFVRRLGITSTDGSAPAASMKRRQVFAWLGNAFERLHLRDEWFMSAVGLLDRVEAARAFADLRTGGSQLWSSSIVSSGDSGSTIDCDGGFWAEEAAGMAAAWSPIEEKAGLQGAYVEALAAALSALKMSEAEAALDCCMRDVVVTFAGKTADDPVEQLLWASIVKAEHIMCKTLQWRVASPTAYDLVNQLAVDLYAVATQRRREISPVAPAVAAAMAIAEEDEGAVDEAATWPGFQRAFLLRRGSASGWHPRFALLASFLVELGVIHAPVAVYSGVACAGAAATEGASGSVARVDVAEVGWHPTLPPVVVALAALKVALHSFGSDSPPPMRCVEFLREHRVRLLSPKESEHVDILAEMLLRLWTDLSGSSEVVKKWRSRSLPLPDPPKGLPSFRQEDTSVKRCACGVGAAEVTPEPVPRRPSRGGFLSPAKEQPNVARRRLVAVAVGALSEDAAGSSSFLSKVDQASMSNILTTVSNAEVATIGTASKSDSTVSVPGSLVGNTVKAEATVETVAEVRPTKRRMMQSGQSNRTSSVATTAGTRTPAPMFSSHRISSAGAAVVAAVHAAAAADIAAKTSPEYVSAAHALSNTPADATSAGAGRNQAPTSAIASSRCFPRVAALPFAVGRTASTRRGSSGDPISTCVGDGTCSSAVAATDVPVTVASRETRSEHAVNPECSSASVGGSHEDGASAGRKACQDPARCEEATQGVASSRLPVVKHLLAGAAMRPFSSGGKKASAPPMAGDKQLSRNSPAVLVGVAVGAPLIAAPTLVPGSTSVAESGPVPPTAATVGPFLAVATGAEVVSIPTSAEGRDSGCASRSTQATARCKSRSRSRSRSDDLQRASSKADRGESSMSSVPAGQGIGRDYGVAAVSALATAGSARLPAPAASLVPSVSSSSSEAVQPNPREVSLAESGRADALLQAQKTLNQLFRGPPASQALSESSLPKQKGTSISQFINERRLSSRVDLRRHDRLEAR